MLKFHAASNLLPEFVMAVVTYGMSSKSEKKSPANPDKPPQLPMLTQYGDNQLNPKGFSREL